MKTIEENNKLIAEFMELKIARLNYNKCENPKYMDGTISPMQFNSSWDWLMPVVNKIRGLYNNTEVMHSDIIDDLAEGCVEANIIQAHNAVVEFIKWYNENK